MTWPRSDDAARRFSLSTDTLTTTWYKAPARRCDRAVQSHSLRRWSDDECARLRLPLYDTLDTAEPRVAPAIRSVRPSSRPKLPHQVTAPTTPRWVKTEGRGRAGDCPSPRSGS
eukprot:7386140-Prymnesium_polylepis.2